MGFIGPFLCLPRWERLTEKPTDKSKFTIPTESLGCPWGIVFMGIRWDRGPNAVETEASAKKGQHFSPRCLKGQGIGVQIGETKGHAAGNRICGGGVFLAEEIQKLPIL